MGRGISSLRSPMASKAYDVIVVGMGASGTTAASTLARAGRRVLALDAQARVGGRVHTVPFAAGVVELGAEWIYGTKLSRVYDAAIQNDIPVIPQDVTIAAFRSDGSVPDQDLVNELVDYCRNIVSEELPKSSETIGQFVSRKLINYLEDKKPEVLNDKEFVESFLACVHNLINVYECSNDWNDSSSSSQFENLEGDLYMSWHKLGYKTFFEVLLNKYNNGPGLPTLEVQLNKEVTQVSWPQQPEQQVAVTCRDGSVYSARAAILTVSLGVLKERHRTLFSPKLPQEKITAIEKVAIGTENKIILSWSERWWPSTHYWFAFMWTEADKAAVGEEDYWTTRIFGATCPMGADNALTLWTTGDIAKMIETLPEDVIKRKCMELLRKFMGTNTVIPEPNGLIRSKWFSNPFTRGSFTFDRAGVPLGLRDALGAPLTDSEGQPRLLFAGEATNPKYFGTVHGASETGYRDAMRLLSVDN